jgi:transposase
VSGPVASSRIDINELRQWLEELVAQMQFARLIAAVIALVTKLRDMNTELTKQLAHLRRARPRSERMRALEAQLLLPFAIAASKPPQSTQEPGAAATDEDEDEDKSTDKTKSRGKHPGRNPLPADMERVPQYNAVPPDQRRCPVCGVAMKSIGVTHCEHLDVIPARVVVVHRTDEALKCPLDGTIVSAPPPPRIVEKGVLGNRLIIEATGDKFLEHQPIERQCLRFARSGADIAPQTLGRAVRAHLDLLAPIAGAIHNRTRGSGLLGTDATGIPVLDRDSPEGIRSGTMWAWTNALWVSFFYSRTGDSESVKRFLGEGNWARDVQADGTNILTFIERAGGKRPGCWAHARRGLVRCARSGDRVAFEGVKMMAPLFETERASKTAGDTAEQRKQRRQRESRLRVEAIRAWVEQQRDITPPTTQLGKALGYIARQWKRLILFLDDGNIPLTNNRRERELRKLVLGRRNWLFVWEDDGGERTANILTIVATCVSHGLNPREYLLVVTNALLAGTDDIDALLPDRIAAAHPELVVPGFDEPELPD